MTFSPFTLPTLTSGILLVFIIFIFLVVLLLLTTLKTSINWKYKLLLIASSLAVYIFTYQGMMSFSGWPSENVLPDKFQIHWTYVKEPDKFSKTEGAIYIWIEELDEYNIPFGIPRSYKLPYTPPLEEEILDVQSNLEAGEAQSATVKKLDKDEIDIYNQKTRENTLPSQDKKTQGYQLFESINGVYQITFGELPETELPDKSPF